MLDSKSPRLYVSDIRGHLERARISPEKFAAETQLSHMTIRRWLKREDGELIPEKYYSLLAPVILREKASLAQSSGVFSVSELMAQIEKSGTECQDLEKLDQDLEQKLQSGRFDDTFLGYCKRLLASIRSNETCMKAKAIGVGALVYFISPVDMIPDHLPLVGYLDDLAVLSLAMESITHLAMDPRRLIAPQKTDST